MVPSTPPMLLGEVFERFVKDGPLCVMVRALLEKALNASTVNSLFEEHAQTQYTRDLLFSSVVDVMSLVVCGMQPSVNAAYKHLQARIPVARKHLYEKINHTEPAISAALVRHTAGTRTELVQAVGGALPALLPGFRVKSSTATVWRPPTIAWRNCAPSPRAHCRASRWWYSTRR